MVGRWKESARQKLQRAVAEVVTAEQERSDERHEQRQQKLHDDVAAALERTRGQLEDVTAALERTSGQLDEVLRRQNELEFRARRDIWYARDLRVTQETAAFVAEHMPKTPVFWDPHDTLR